MTSTSPVSSPAFVERLTSKAEDLEHLNFNDLFNLLLKYLLQYMEQKQNQNPVYLQQHFAISEHTITQLIFFLRNPTPVKKHVKFFDDSDNTLMSKKNWWLITEDDSVMKLKKVSRDETYVQYEEVTEAAQIMQELKTCLDYKGQPKTISDLGLHCVVAYDLERYYIHKGNDYDFFVDVVPLEQKVAGPTYYVTGCVRIKDPAARFAEQKLERLKVVLPVRRNILQVISAWHPSLLKKIEEAGFVYQKHFVDESLTHYSAHPLSPESQERDYQLIQEYRMWLSRKTEEQKKFMSKTQDPEELFNSFKCSQMQPPESEDHIEYEDSEEAAKNTV